MRGRKPKEPALRQRRNKTSTAATLTASGAGRAPSLPTGTLWHPQTKAWWKDVWHSPMATAFLEADKHALYRLAILINDYWMKPSPMLGAEIRQQEARFGLTPLDRMRLQWKVEPDEEATKAEEPEGEIDDPRVIAMRRAR